MIITSAVSYLVNEAIQKGIISSARKVNFEMPLTVLVWLTSLLSVAVTFVVSYLLIPELGDGRLWWILSIIIRVPHVSPCLRDMGIEPLLQ